MNNVERVSVLQVLLFLVNFRILPIFSYLPAINAPPANQDIWISELLSFIYTIVLALPLIFLGYKFNGMTLIQYSEKIMGKLLGKFIGILVIGLFLFQCVITLNSATGFLRSTIFSITPEYATGILIVLTCIYVVFKGIEVIIRGSEIFVPSVLVVIIVFICLGIKNMDFKEFLPILSDSNFKDLNIGAINVVSQYTELLLLAMIIPNINQKRKLTKIVVLFTSITTILLLAITMSTQATIGIKASTQANYPFFLYTRLINVYDFIQRIESINVLAWVTVSIGKFSTYLYFATIGIKQVFNTKSNKPFIVPLAFILLILSMTLSNRKSVILNKAISYKVYPFITLPYIIVIPLIMLVVFFFRKKTLDNAS